MNDFKEYKSGQYYVEPAAVEAIRAEMDRLPVQLVPCVAAILCAAMAWRWTGNWDATGLFGLIGWSTSALFFKMQTISLRQELREEQTRAIVREIAAELAHDIERLQDSIEPLISPYKPDYGDPTRDA